MPGMRCAIYGCNNSRVVTKIKNPSIVYHTFPKGKDFVSQTIMRKWISNCQRADKVNPGTAVICSIHFTQNDYERDLRNELLGLPSRKVLKKTAVPTLNLPGKLKYMDTITSRKTGCTEKVMRDSVDTAMKEGISFNELIPEHATIPDYEQPYSSASVSGVSLESIEKKYEDLLKNYNELKNEYSGFKRQSQYKIKSLNAQVKYYKKKSNLRSPAQNKEAAKNLLEIVLTRNQIDLLSKKKKVVRWTPEEIAIAFTIRYYSKKCYMYFKNKLHYPLPSLSSLRRWASNLNVSQGILTDVMMMLRLAGESFTPLDKTTVISFDEVKIKKVEEYDVENDKILGPYSQMQVMMVRSLFSNWKQPIYIGFDQKMTKEILFEVLSELHKIGFDTVACVSDCGGSNVGLWKELGISIEKTFFKHPETNKNIYMFADAPHLLKLIRNWLIDTGFQCGDGKIINKKPLQALVSLTDAEVNACWKISRAHILCEKSQRQNVKLAAQLLSNTVSTALIRYTPGENKTMAEDLGNFISDVNNWFDIFNSYKKEGIVPTKSAYGMNLKFQGDHLNKIIDLFSTLRVQGKSSLQIFQKGLLISTRSLQLLYEDMRGTLDIHYICTHKLNQDCLENFFSQLRSRGPNDHPSPLEAIKRIRMIILGKNPGILGAKTNTVAQDEDEEYVVTTKVVELANIKIKLDDSLVSNESNSGSSFSSASGSFNIIIDMPSDLPAPQETTEDAFEYIAGYLAKKHKETFPHLGDHTYKIKCDHSYNIPTWVQQLSYGGLIKPTENWLRTVLQWNVYFEKFHGLSYKPGVGVVKKLAAKIAKKDKMPYKLIFDFCKLRTIMRMNFRNLLSKEKALSAKRKNNDNDSSRRTSKKIKKLTN